METNNISNSSTTVSKIPWRGLCQSHISPALSLMWSKNSWCHFGSSFLPFRYFQSRWPCLCNRPLTHSSGSRSWCCAVTACAERRNRRPPTGYRRRKKQVHFHPLMLFCPKRKTNDYCVYFQQITFGSIIFSLLQTVYGRRLFEVRLRSNYFWTIIFKSMVILQWWL